MNFINVTSMIINAACVAALASVGYAKVSDMRQTEELLEYDQQHQCMALNIYHEARSDSKLGQTAVGFVTLNRGMSNSYPNTVCDVVYQSNLNSKGHPIRNQCQFSWYCDGKDDTPKDENIWGEVQATAHEVLTNYGIVEDFTENAIMYHASYVNPYWASSYEKTVRIDNHIFYK